MSKHTAAAEAIAADIRQALEREALAEYAEAGIVYTWTGKLELRDGAMWAEFTGNFDDFWATMEQQDGFLKNCLSSEWA